MTEIETWPGSGPPVHGSPTGGPARHWQLNEIVLDTDGVFWKCTAHGTAGRATWEQVGSGGGSEVSSVNSHTGAVVLDASDVGAQPAPTGTPDGTKFLADDGSWKAPDSGASGLSFQYLEWTPSVAATQSVVLTAGTQVIAAWVLTDIAWDRTTPTAEVLLSAGTDAHPVVYLDAQGVDLLGTVWHVGDLSGTRTLDPQGIPLGFPFSADSLSIFPSGGSITGTISFGDATLGRTRLYYFAGIPTAA